MPQSAGPAVGAAGLRPGSGLLVATLLTLALVPLL